MSTHTPLSLIVLGLAAYTNAQSSASTALEPLASKHFTWPDIPYQVTGNGGGVRGPQRGFNLCNSTTETQDSLCQTLFLNNLGDFCMWSSDITDDTIGEGEAREVAWCTGPGHGTRIIPPGAITGAQWLYAKNYVQVVGFIDQTQVGLQASDQGGELDPHGADEQGNPLGGIVFTNGFGKNSAAFQQIAAGGNFNNDQQYTQVIEWVDFIGGGVFCLKMCNPNDPEAAQLCQHIYDEIGCSYNVLADYNNINGTFSACDSDDMAPPGIFTTNGQLTTWFQPAEQPFTPPYTPVLPASSNCVTYQSTQLFAAATTVPVFASSLSAAQHSSTAGTSGPTGSGSTSTRSGSGANPSNTDGAANSAVDLLPLGAMPYIGMSILTMVVSALSMLS